MKKYSALSVYAIIALAILAIVSCSKEKEQLIATAEHNEFNKPSGKAIEEVPLRFANFIDSLNQLRIPENESVRLDSIISSSEYSDITFEILEDDISILSSILEGQVLNASRIQRTIHILRSEHAERTELIQSLDYLLGMFIYLEHLDEGQKMSDFDACFNQCMRKKADDVFTDGNWVDQAAFLSGAPVNVAWWTGSCVWNCA